MKDKFIQVIKNKWLRSVALTILLVAIIVFAYLAINYAIEKANFSDIDMTKDKVYSISQETEDKLNNLESDVTISVYNMTEYIKDFINKYTKLNEHIKIEEVESLLSKTNWQTEYGVTDTSAFIVISSNGKEKILYDYNLVTYDYTNYEQIDITEEAITNGIIDVITTVKPKIYFLTGHNLYPTTYFTKFSQYLEDEANEIAEVNLLSAGNVPEDCKLLIITTLKEDIKEIERDAIIKYINKGGKILLLSSPNIIKVNLANFQKVLDEYGISISDGIIMEGDTSKMVSGYTDVIMSQIDSGCSIVKNINMDLNVCLMDAGKISIASVEELEKKNVTSEILASASNKAYMRTNLQTYSSSRIDSDEDAANATVGALLTKKIDDNTSSKLIVFSDGNFASDRTIMAGAYNYYLISYSNNFDVLLNSVSYLTEREDNITIRKNVEAVTYQVSELQNRIILSVIFGIPVLIIVIGIVVWVMRRRKK